MISTFIRAVLCSAACLTVPFAAEAQDPVRILDRVVVVEGNTPSIQDLVAEPTIGNMELSPNGKYVAAVRRDGRDYYLIVADITADEIEFVGTRFEDLRIFDVHWATNDRLVVDARARFNASTRGLLKQDDWYDPDVRSFWVPALYGIDRDGSNLIRFFEGNRQMDNIFTEVSLLSFVKDEPGTMLVTMRAPELSDRSRDGAELFAYVTLPEGGTTNGPMPFVMYPPD